MPSRVLALLEAFGPASVRDLATVCERTPRMVRYALVALRAEGVVRQVATRPARWGVA